MNRDDISTSPDRDRFSTLDGGYSGGVSEMDRELRPFGISLVAIFAVLGALLNLFLALNAWIRAQELRQAPVLSILFLIEALVALAVAVGLWKLSEWARICAVLLYGLTLVINFIANFNEPLTASSLTGLVVPAAIVIYLIQPKTVEKFI